MQKMNQLNIEIQYHKWNKLYNFINLQLSSANRERDEYEDKYRSILKETYDIKEKVLLIYLVKYIRIKSFYKIKNT